MGGYGSGRWGYHTKRTTVEDCLRLTMKHLNGPLSSGPGRCGSLSWSRGDNPPHASIAYATEADGDGLALRLTYSKGQGDEKRSMDYLVRVVSTTLPSGGLKWWFLCPLQGCGQRALKLYLPPGGSFFGCRKCYHLTYESCQESHKFDGLFKELAANMGPGWTPQAVRMGLEKDYTPRDLRMMDALVSGTHDLQRAFNKMNRKKGKT